jgi:hypothetical protein
VKARRRPAKIKQAASKRALWRLQADMLRLEQTAAERQVTTHRTPDRKA